MAGQPFPGCPAICVVKKATTGCAGGFGYGVSSGVYPSRKEISRAVRFSSGRNTVSMRRSVTRSKLSNALIAPATLPE